MSLQIWKRIGKTIFHRNDTWLVLMAVLLLLSGPARAQVLYGSLTGNVTDPSGAIVPGANVEALNVSTGVSRQTTSDDRGVYLFTLLQPGIYKVTISASGFSQRVTDNIRIDANTLQRNDVQLQLGQVSQSVVVEESATRLQTDRADVLRIWTVHRSQTFR